ncbi:MAG TPA: hypothetical protein VIV06_09845 [Candidatus Limnocylindrales bacterium]
MTSEHEPEATPEAATTPETPAEPTQSMEGLSEFSSPTGDGAATGGDGWTSFEASGPAEQHASWMVQLQSMIDNLARQSGPTLRELAAKAAELAAKAGESAGPVAHRAAEVTGDVGHKVAVKGREVAADLRRGAEQARSGTVVAEPTVPGSDVGTMPDVEGDREPASEPGESPAG